MADSQRLTVKDLVLHQAVTPLWDEKSKAQLAQWFSDNGYARAYGSNPANWSGLINPYTGQRSYSQAHLAGQRVTDRTPDATAAEKAAGYRLVPLIKDIWGQIAWHAGNWQINRSSIGIENLGDYRNYTLRDGDCKVIADFWRGQDRKLDGKTMVWGHLEVSQLGTACPARIMEKRNHIIDLVNGNGPSTEPSKPTPQPSKKSNQEIANEVLAGKWGNNPERRAKLIAAGYDYNAIQAIVNGSVGNPVEAPARKSNAVIAKEVVAGAWGNNPERKQRLEAAGYNYAAIQAIVNGNVGPAPAKPKRLSNEQVADQVLAGAWGVGPDRRNRLVGAGYDYNAVQSIVNQKLGQTNLGKKSNEEIANQVLQGSWGNGPERKQRITAAGYDYAAVQAIVNRKLGL